MWLNATNCSAVKPQQNSVKYCCSLLNQNILSQHPLELIGVGNGLTEYKKSTGLLTGRTRQKLEEKNISSDHTYLSATPKKWMYARKSGQSGNKHTVHVV